MSDPVLDALSEAARNRGLKLVRSRIRTAAKAGYGKVALVNEAGQPIFGMGTAGPSADPAEAEDYLRNLEVSDWGASLKLKQPSRRREADQASVAAATSAKRASREIPPKPAPPPPPTIRTARLSDAPRLTQLICELGHQIELKAVRRNLEALAKTDGLPLVAVTGDLVIGMCEVAKRIAINRASPVGRITSLIVTKDVRGKGAGKLLVEAAEEWMRARGCGIAEVTSNDRLSDAHGFYRHLGYERTSIRFAKTL